jgi:homocysteine S-methyltransferase
VIDLLAPFVSRRGAVLLDGGLATELERRGVDLSDPLWSARALLDAPEVVEAVHRDYLEAGADVITTATYQATIPGLLARGLSESRAEAALRRGVELARHARDAFAASRTAPRPLVAASIGSYGAFLANGAEYRGGYGLSVAALAVWHRPRVRVLEDSGADLLAFETIPSREEAEAIARVLDERDGPPAWIAFNAPSSSAIADGTPIETALAVASAAKRVAAVGFNCIPPEQVAPLLARAADATDRLFVAYPNRGDVWDATRRGWIVRDAEVEFASLARAWREAGAKLIGGCCRTTPDDIRRMRSGLDS